MRKAFIFSVVLCTAIIMLSGCEKLNGNSDINSSMIESVNSSSQSNIFDFSSSESDETISSSSSKYKNSDSSDEDILEFGSVDIL